jgi:hypothetical protein
MIYMSGRDERMKRGMIFLAVLAMLAAGWTQRDQLMQWFQGAEVVENAPPTADIVYQWVDDKGVPHFSQEPGKGRQAVVYDGSKTTVVESVTESVVGLPAEGKEKKPAGHEILNLRKDLEQNARTMSDTRDARQGI